MEPNINYEMLAKSMLKELNVATYKHTTPTGTPTGVMAHGNGGLFSSPALEKQIFSALILPQNGLQGILPVFPSVKTDPLYAIMTGVTATTGSEPYGVCDDPPYAGLMKICKQSAPFGRWSRMTREFELDAFGKMRDNGDQSDLQLMNLPWNPNNPNVPTIAGLPGNPAQSSIIKALFELGVAWSRDFARILYTGSPGNNTVGGGYREFYGLDVLINTGYRDVETTTVCPAADSYIKSFGNLNIDTQMAALVQQLTWMVRHLRDIAGRTNLMPATWALAMRPMLFYMITEGWPCSYLTYRCTTSAGNESAVYANDAVALRDEMRQGSYLMIDGMQIPVVQDDAIAETSIGAGVYSSSIYQVPLTVLGGIPATYMEYMNYNTPGGLADAGNVFAANGFYDTSDNGRFAWHWKPPKNWCVQGLAKTEPRIVLRTPYIAGRLTDIRYTPVVHERDWGTSDTYYVDGGGTSQTSTTYYSPQA